MESQPKGFELIVLDERGRPTLNGATKSIPIFKELFARRRRKGASTNLVSKDAAEKMIMKEFQYIYYMIDIRSFAVQKFPSKDQDQDRHDLIVERLEFPEGYMPDNVVLEACKWYSDFHFGESPLLRMVKAGFIAINKTIQYLEDIDFNKQSYSPKSVIDWLAGLKEQKHKLEEMMQESLQDINLGGKPRGGGKLNMFENPDREKVNGYNRVPESI